METPTPATAPEQSPPGTDAWPALPYEAWAATQETLHMWTQIVGKIRLKLSPPLNHWWNSALYVTARGLTTSAMPYGDRTFEIQFDFVDHNLVIPISDGTTRYMALYPRAVADFFKELMAILHQNGIDVTINTLPQEVPNPIRCDVDTVHDDYDAEAAHRFWRVLAQTDMVFKQFRGGFVGKASPVHFWWGSFDLAVTRFSGHRAPERPGADRITREAYSHECTSVGFWPGSSAAPAPVYYAYFAPEPPGFKEAPVRPGPAFYSAELGEFLLKYDDVRAAVDPRAFLLEFLQSTYDAGADLGHWDREALDWQPAR
jgi:hypothetical protein